MEVNQTPPVKEEIPALVKPEKGWYAIYTHSRAEKRVSDRLKENGIETFLPLQKTLRQWSDRKKLVERPLISSYVFVKVLPKDFFTVRTTDGVVKFIMLQGKPVVIPEIQITNLRILCGSDVDVAVSNDVYARGDNGGGDLRLPHRPPGRADQGGKKTQGGHPYHTTGNEPHS